MAATTFTRNMSVGARLSAGFGVVVALLVLLAFFTLSQVAHIRMLSEEASGLQAERLSLAKEWRENVSVNGSRAVAIAFSSDATLSTKLAAIIKASSARTSEIQKRFKELETTPEGMALQDKLGTTRKGYIEARDVLLKAQAAGGSDPGAAEVFRKLVAGYVAVASELVTYQERRSQLLNDQVASAMASMRVATLIITAACVALAVLLGWALKRSIVRPLAEAQATADRIASGDLSVELSCNRKDEVGALLVSLASMQQSLRTLVGDIRLSVNNIGVASAEVAAGNQDLSVRTEQAAANLQQTASSVNQLSNTIRHTASSAATANELAVAASSVAQKGGKAVVDAVTTMEAITASSKRISEIIGVIDGIAFQTNILALNAAVEAARAGEQGRGFAVVASEVRSLAQRSAGAAKEIKALIGDSVTKIEAGSSQVREAGETMSEIVASVGRVTATISEITSAASEQAQGVGELNGAITRLDQATQQNAALVEESAAAAESLRDQSNALSSSVQRFVLQSA